MSQKEMVSTQSHHLSTLNERQKKAVTHCDGPLLVLAGAGSGKTRVIVERIAFLIEEKEVEPNSIVALTFTNKAAKEMKERLSKRLGGNFSSIPWMGTFHSFGLKILRSHAEALGINPQFAIYDSEDSLKLLKHLFPKESKEQIKTLRQGISAAKNIALGPQDLSSNGIQSARGIDFFDREVEDVDALKEAYSRYEEEKRLSGALDFDDLLYLCVELFQKHPQILEKYQNEIEYLLIDEYQDTNSCQYLMTALLAKKHQNIFAVGDPDQSIYSWRGANIGNILQFEEDFAQAKVLRLECNYRSTPEILHASNELISHNKNRLPKKLFSPQKNGAPLQLLHCYDGLDEAQRIIEKIEQELEKGRSPSEIAIFYRTNFQSRSFEDHLIAAHIPYTIVGGLSFYQRKEIKDILSILRCLFFPCDLVSFARVINLPKRGIGPKSLAKLHSAATSRRISYKEAVALPSSESGLTKKAQEGFSSFFALIEQLQAIKEEKNLSLLVEEAIAKSDYLNYLRTSEDNFLEREENLNELIAKAHLWQTLHPNDEPIDFFQEIALAQSHDQKGNSDQETIQLMTVHHSKGLEFPVVFVVGLEEQLFPHVYSKMETPDVEEERRLLYVAMTRAMEKLTLSYTKRRFMWGSWRQMHPSRFLFEIPDLTENLDEEETIYIY